MKMNRFYFYISALICAMLSIVGCSTKKNTAMSRGYQAMTTKFNVYYNGNEALQKGKKKIEEAYKPDYTRTLKMYAVSDETTKDAAKGDASRASEKCEKAIKLHSMRKKPVKNVKKMKDPKYATFYAQEEFNPMMDDVWMLLGKSKYYGNDYLAASATFTYVQNHFQTNEDLVTQASLWKAKSLKEMNWIYEAEEILNNIDEDKITYNVEGLYNSTIADIKLAQGYEDDALPYLLKSIKSAENRSERARFLFIIAQIYQNQGKNKEAYAYYDTVIRKSPNYEMEFNARIRQTEVYTSGSGEAKNVIHKLEKLTKDEKNKDYLDQIHYAIGNVYIREKDTASAIKNYRLAAEKSTRNGVEKAVALLTLGRLYWNNREYIKAEPCYAEASSILSNKHPEYEDVSSKALKLTELKQNYDIVHLQDSLLALSTASPEERMAAVQREIKKIEEQEKAERERQIAMEREQKLLDMEIQKVESENVNSNNGKSWYFFNQQTVSKGKLEFQRRYGQRRLEDNWNRKNKSSVSFDEPLAENNEEEEVKPSDPNNPQDRSERSAGENQYGQNMKNPDYYLRQIPMTPEQKAVSLSQVENALFAEALTYSEKIEDYPLALETFEEYIRRFGNKDKAADALFYSYNIAQNSGNAAKAEEYKNKLIEMYPDTKYAQILGTPDYQEKLMRMNKLQDSIYTETYEAYLKSDYNKVKANAEFMEKNYAVSNLMPKFMMLKALSHGKQGEQDSLQKELKTIIAKYPNSDVTSMAKDIIALIEQGGVTQAGTSSSLASEREQMLVESTDGDLTAHKNEFTFSKDEPYLFFIITKEEEVNRNQLLFNVATYNFTKFLVKDFDLKIRQGIVTVSGFDNLDEALWYANGVKADSALTAQLNGKEHTLLVISEDNSKLIGRGHTIDEYKQWYANNITNRKQEKADNKVKLIDENKKAEEEAKTTIQVSEGQDLTKVSVTPATETKQEPASTSEPTPAVTPENNASESQNATEKEEKPNTQPQETKEEVKAEPKKDVKKYKNLYTFDRNMKHYFAILVAKGVVKSEGVMKLLNDFNADSAPLLNLKVAKTEGKNLPLIITVGMMADSKMALDYLKQIVRNAQIKNLLGDAVYKHVIITEENLEALKTSGNVSAYMELFKKGYLGK